MFTCTSILVRPVKTCSIKTEMDWGLLPESYVQATKKRQEISGNIYINHNTSAVKCSFRFPARLWWNLVEMFVFLQVTGKIQAVKQTNIRRSRVRYLSGSVGRWGQRSVPSPA